MARCPRCGDILRYGYDFYSNQWLLVCWGCGYLKARGIYRG